jgi:hypothetical protein
MADTTTAINPVAPVNRAISIPLPSYHHLQGRSKRVNGVLLSSYQWCFEGRQYAGTIFQFVEDE